MSAIPPNLSIGSVGGAAAGALGSLVGGIGANIAAGDQTAGYTAEANDYGQAATIAGENATITEQSTQLQQYMSNRALAQTQSATAATTAGNGLGLTGSEQYLVRQNAAQGGLASAIIGQQGTITENGYKTQQQALLGEQSQAQAAASAASSSGTMGLLGGILGAAGSIFKLFA